MENYVFYGKEDNRNSDYCSKEGEDKTYRLHEKSEIIASCSAEIEPLPEEIEKETKVVIKTTKGEIPKVEKIKGEKVFVTVVTRTFDHPVRLFWNRRFEEKNSSCAKAGTELTFETISEGIYRIRRGKRNFFTNDEELAKSGVEKL